jgi:hypothetical protein
MAVRVFNAAGKGMTADIISGIYYAVNNDAKILNMSFGGYNYDQAQYDAIEYARNNNVIIVASAGNYNSDNDTEFHHYPSDYDHDNIISVAALDQSYELAAFSNYGNISVDVGAPGTNIQSIWNGSETLLVDPLTSGWTESGTNGWDYAVHNFGYGNVNLLVNPDDWSSPPIEGLYSNNSNDKIWKTFNISGYESAVLKFSWMQDLESGYDAFLIYCDNGTSDPLAI